MPSDTSRPNWKFFPHGKGDKSQDPVQREFFKTNAVRSLAGSLVREAIQNALDARLKPNEPVGIRFAIIERPRAEWDELLSQLHPHLQVVSEISDNKATLVDPALLEQDVLRFLILEDFNTSGLTGDPALDEPPTDPEKRKIEHFYYFWRNVGRTGKSGGDRGSWGLGKTVFPAASRLSTFFGLTVRADGRTLLMGESVLKQHSLDGRQYKPYGSFGMFEDAGDAPDFCLPLEKTTHAQHIAWFKHTFMLERGDHPGLSIVIPAPHDNITLDRLIAETIDEYFYLILKKQLGIRTTDGQHESVISQHNLLKVLDGLDMGNLLGADFDVDAFKHRLRFAQWVIKEARDQIIEIRQPNDDAPKWKRYLPSPVFDDAALADARARFQTKKKIAFRIWVPIKAAGTRGKAKDHGWFEVYLEEDEQLKRMETYYLRSGIWIREVKPKSTFNRIRAIVLIEADEDAGKSNPLTRLLAKAENPAHTQWTQNAEGLNDEYSAARDTIAFVSSSVGELMSQLFQLDKQRDPDLLSEFFSLRDDSQPATARKPTQSATAQLPDGRPPTSDLLIESRPQPARIGEWGEDGLVIRGTDAPLEPMEARFGYAVRKGKATEKYDPLDFDLAEPTMEVVADGVTIEQQTGNLLHFQVDKPDFYIIVTGFDGLRDVECDLKPLRAGSTNGDDTREGEA